jgi:hypothetical protein
MATADQYADWIVRNKDKKGSKEFETVAAAYRLAKEEEGAVTAPAPAPAAPAAEIPTRRRGPSLADVGDRATGFRAQVEATGMTPEQRQAAVAGMIPYAVGAAAGPAAGAVIRGAGVLAPAISRVTAPLAEAVTTSGFRAGVPATAPAAKRVALRAAGGAIPGAITGATVSPEEAGTGAAIGAGISVLAPPVAKIVAKGGGYIADAVQGRLADTRANELLRATIGNEVNQLRQLMAAQPDVPASRIAAQYKQQLPALQALLAEAEALNPTGAANAFRQMETADVVNELSRIAGGRTAEATRVAQVEAKKALTAKTTPMREKALAEAAPTSPQPLVSAIDRMLTSPSVRNDDFAQKVLQRVKEKIANVTSKEGVIDPVDLYEIRKSAINNAITELNPGIDAKSRNNYVSGLLGELRDKLDETMKSAGGESFKKYLNTFEAGMNDIEDMRLANRIRSLYEKDSPASKQRIVDLLEGESPETIQRVLKSRRFKLDEVLVKDQELLNKVKTNLGLDLEAARQAKAGVKELARIREESSVRIRFPFFTRISTAFNEAVSALEDKISRQTMDEIIKSAQSGRDFNRILDALSTKERSAFLAQFKNAESWSRFSREVANAARTSAITPPPERQPRNALAQ